MNMIIGLILLGQQKSIVKVRGDEKPARKIIKENKQVFSGYSLKRYTRLDKEKHLTERSKWRKKYKL